jgi:predicted ATPase
VLLDGLRSRAQLLVLDNAEHVWAACGRLVDLITRSCPGVRIIATSRRPLGFSGERVLGLARLGPGAAAELLRRRAAEHGRDGELADARAEAGLCQLLDGLPLALELAAARLRTMPLRALIERIAVRPDFLAAAGRPGLAHQRGLSDTVRWSYDLLDGPSRLLLTRVAAFPGGFGVADAERGCGAPPLVASEVTALLSGLADNSLVEITDDRAGRCYRLPVPVRAFALSRAAAGGPDGTRTRHPGRAQSRCRAPSSVRPPCHLEGLPDPRDAGAGRAQQVQQDAGLDRIQVASADESPRQQVAL